MDEPFRDPDASPAVRLADLVARLTVAEKVALLHQHQAAIPRLDIAAFKTGTEALHGVAWLGIATVFPQAVGLGATWDPDLVRRVGAAVGDEVRGMHRKDPGVGLNVWAPVVNPLRDPRWGRNEEGYAEDPWLTGVLGTAYASGLRGDHPTYLRTVPTLKHFLGYNNETDRHLTSSDLPPRVLHEYELPAFRAPIEAGAAGAVMASYNLVNGRPAHVSPLLGTLREWTSDDLLVVGDAGAASNLAGEQGTHPDQVTGFAAALRAGVDCFTEDGADPVPTIRRITEALERGLVEPADVDRAVTRVLGVRLRLGEFDPPERNPYAAVTTEVVNCPDHQRLAREAARRAIVLLRNDGVLPIRAGQSVAVVGPLGDTVLLDWYSGSLPYAVTAVAGLAERLGSVRCAEGADRVALVTARGGVRTDGGTLRVTDEGDAAHFDVLDWGSDAITLRAVSNGRYVRADEQGVLVNDRPGPGEWVVRETFEATTGPDGTVLRSLAADRWVTVAADGVLRADALTADLATPFQVDLVSDGIEAAVAAARDVDVVIVALGSHPMVGGRETQDRADLALPPAQAALLRAVQAANPRTVLLLVSGYPYAIGPVAAVLWSAHGGQEFGAALADVLLGRTADGEPAEPVGRLPQTWYADATALPDLLDYDIISADATYQYFRGVPLYPFGHGLGYTRFVHSDLRCAGTVGPDGQVELSVDVRNVGDRPGEEVVQLYSQQRSSRVKQPLRRLRGFRRLRLAPGASETVTLTLRAQDLAIWDTRPVVEDAEHTVWVGRSCLDAAAVTSLRVRGERIGARDPLRVPLRAADRDAESGTVLTAETPERGDAVLATGVGSWLAFHDVDLASAARQVVVRVAAPPGGTRVTVRLDDPISGLVAADLEVPAGRTEVSGELVHPGAVHDLYLVLGAAGTRVAGLEFRA
ncbi:beta-glucosidase [Asanoa ishikariensis]|uniref:Exo-1,4-beta-glucosidase n=1 Tax=Asanoa ishikariensis TaxID=137265 RepID=A0A1H3SYQ4_9ACTN|nr:glycoside hydrolase family 3 protein [Asanoa ishikariensis]GIF63223.1 beta-glucosidase [Asanoa ishikariensis]SDZ43253.1 exo-1,4-beta-glucosidase [Asanoa ishikariensis]